MQDRVSLYPGRVKLVPVAGQENTYDMVRADSPTQEGTPLNKDTLLKDTTAALFGLGADAVPDDVLAFLGKYNQHWWARRTALGWTEQKGETVSGYLYSMSDSSASLKYSETISISNTGTIELVNPITVTGDSYNGSLPLKDKYFQVISGGSLNIGTIYYATENIGGSYSITAQPVTAVQSASPGEWGYIQSNGRNTYPDTGISNGYEYKYLGIPLENAVTAPAIATGSYTGTGTHGSNNQNSLTFDFEPKLLLIFEIITAGTSSDGYVAMMTPGSPCYWTSGDYGLNGSNNVFWTKNTVSWFNNADRTNGLNAVYCIRYQLNKIDVTYNYIAIG